MRYGAEEREDMKYPPNDKVKWAGYDKTKLITKTVSCMAKTWFEARNIISKELETIELGNLVITAVEVKNETA